MLQWYQFEVDRLHRWPHHPVLFQRRTVCALQFLLWISPLQVSHTTQETKEIRRREDCLVDQHPSGDGRIGTFQVDVLLQKPEPQSCTGAEDSYSYELSGSCSFVRGNVSRKTSAVERHAAGPCQTMVLGANTLDTLLAHDISGREEYLGRRYQYWGETASNSEVVANVFTAVVMDWVRIGRCASLI